VQAVILQLLQWALSVLRGRRIGRRAASNGIDAKGLFIRFPRPAVNRGCRTSGPGGERTIDSERRHGQEEGSVRRMEGKLPKEDQTSMETSRDRTTVCPPLEDDRSEVCIGRQCLCRRLL
jgi:hypothetical protein